MSNSDKILTDGTELPEDVLVSRLAVDVDVLVTDCINRIEALKMQLMRMPGPEADRAHQVADLDILRATCLYLGEKARGMPEIQELPEDHVIGETAQPRMEIPSIVGRNAIITKNLNTISKIAPTRLSMLLEGETGSGKELFAKLIHLNSGRNKLVTVNCGAFPPGVIESELFGHVRGAFTGAFADRKGKFEEADGGTIFLDEIGDLELQAQVKLLRVLDSGEIQRVGSDRIFRTDVRVIAATNRDLHSMVADGRFREDLYYRLSQCHLWVPPLRERRDEISILFEFFVKKSCEQYGRPLPVLDDSLRHYLFDVYTYPGNVRELKNLADYIVHIFAKRPVRIDDLPERYQQNPEAQVPAGRAARRAIHKTAERDMLIAAMVQHGGDVQKSCTTLDLSRSRLYQLLKQHDIRPADYK